MKFGTRIFISLDLCHAKLHSDKTVCSTLIHGINKSNFNNRI